MINKRPVSRHKFETKYGYFSENGDEYVIKTPRTPKPWINVISNGRYGLTISQAGGGFSWLDHSEFNRLNRWHQDLVRDDWGKYLYLKDLESEEVWNPTWLPSRTEPELFECTHGFGYTRFKTVYKGIRTILTIFVPLGKSLEVWDINIENISDRARHIELITYFEWCLGSSTDHHREFHKTFIGTRLDRERNAALATKRLWDIGIPGRGHWNKSYPYIGFLTASRPITDFEFDKDTFIGQYGTLQNPAFLNESARQHCQGTSYDAVAGSAVRLTVEARQSTRMHYLCGLAENLENLDRFRAVLNDSASVDKSLQEVRTFWADMLSRSEVETPDESLNLLTNKWLRYQAISGRLWARTAYYQQSGAYGFRDQLQDSLIFLDSDPDLTARQIGLHAEHQFQNGHVLHWWHPITNTGMDSNFSDDFLWLPFVTLSYLEETSDSDFLKKSFSYYDNPIGGSILEHCTRAIDFALKRLSERGVPLIGSGDWNDGLSAAGIDMKGESFWVVHFLYFILIRFTNWLKKAGDEQKAEYYISEATRLSRKLLEFGWDGGWFRQGTKDNGELIGSQSDPEGKIFLNVQTWSVIADSVPLAFQHKAMAAVVEQLMKSNGPLLLYPSYHAPDEYIGYLSRYAAGIRENGGVYTHAATWAIQAFARLNQDDLAYRTFMDINPVQNGMEPDRYKAEPYVTPGNIDGPDSEHYGRGGWTWYTGSAAWLQKSLMEWILGIRAGLTGLIVDPHVPPEWPSYRVKRLFRGTLYDIHFTNESGKAGAVKRLIIDGKPTLGNVIPPARNKTCRVEVTL